MGRFLKYLQRRISQRRRKRFFTSYQSVITDIGLARQAEATKNTASYVSQHMSQVQSVNTWQGVHDVAMEQVCIDNGLCLEFGVYRGTSINYIAARRNWQVIGFDSFEGLPEDWRDGYPKGTFLTSGPPAVAPNVTLQVGWFNQTLPHFRESLDNPDQPIAYLHIDSDLYSSAATIFDVMGQNIVPGTVIVFDEYFNYPGWEDGAFRAFQEYLTRHGQTYRYIVYNRTHQQVAIVVSDAPSLDEIG